MFPPSLLWNLVYVALSLFPILLRLSHLISKMDFTVFDKLITGSSTEEMNDHVL